MNYGEMFLSAVLERNDVGAFKRYGLEERHFLTEEERRAYRFIVDYAEQNGGNAPDFRTVVAEVDGFSYCPNVSDSFEYLAQQIKNYAAKIAVVDFLQREAPEVFQEKGGLEFLDWLIERADDLKRSHEFRQKVGVSVKKDTSRYLEEYRTRKQGKSFKVWKSHFPTLNEEIGGYLSGNMYTWYGRSGRGKSIFAITEIVASAFQGATCLIWSLEMSEFETLTRLYVAVSSFLELFEHEVDGNRYKGGFPARELLLGRLTESYEKGLESFLSYINEYFSGEIIVRAADHEDFYRRDCAQLEQDILQTKADVVLVDPIYYMDFERNTSKTKGGDIANTSKRLKRIAGITKTVVHVITQADEVKDEMNANGVRELRPPRRDEIKKTKQVLEDATNTFGIDSCDGRGLIVIRKGRFGGEDIPLDTLFLPNFGIVREITPEECAEHFDCEDFVF